ncbi:double-CXXCG motif protein [Hyalangium rubrum]|uniref:Double-CXXCG motif protein n=1 Tax=Hyalangium rubrum TaxID=3103134 RepID=A0ABU5H1R9_9BACT|nr:double-CXXCG motif protein [Hyalangium sp. s54d21]MDY7226859.1 double-CXXCG motif protein [Hyalangium sp. s54d21]
MRFYRLREDEKAGYTGDISAASKWGLPGARCPGCGATWASAATAYPCVDLSQHPNRAEFVVPRPEPLEEFERLRELIKSLVPPGARIPPGTRFGPLVGKAWGSFGAFFFQNPWVLVVRREAMESLQDAGVQGLEGRKPELRFRQKNNPPELVELQLVPLGLLHPDCLPPRPPPCSRCGRDGFKLPEDLILDAASLPTHTDVFRLGNFATVLVGNERFKDAVQRLGLDGIVFHELPLR